MMVLNLVTSVSPDDFMSIMKHEMPPCAAFAGSERAHWCQATLSIFLVNIPARTLHARYSAYNDPSIGCRLHRTAGV